MRELRNYLERCLVFEETLPLGEHEGEGAGNGGGNGASAASVDPNLPYAEARRRALDSFEGTYARELLALHGGRVSVAARAAGIDRVYLHRLMRRHGVGAAAERAGDAVANDAGEPPK